MPLQGEEMKHDFTFALLRIFGRTNYPINHLKDIPERKRNMKSIYKYTLEFTDYPQLSLPIGAKILAVQMQEGNLTLWALVDTYIDKEITYFRIIGTGHPIKEEENYKLEYISTVQDRQFIWHIFKIIT